MTIARSRFCGEGDGLVMGTRPHPVQAVVMAMAYTLSVVIPAHGDLSPGIESVCAAIAAAAIVPLALFIVFCLSAGAEWSARGAVEVGITITRGCIVALAAVLSLSSMP
mgnify:CR=1 FL=1